MKFACSSFEPPEKWIPGASRAERLTLRAAAARLTMAECHLCAHDCGANRLAGELGPCRSGPHGRVFSAQLEVGDELELIPTFAIALSGCDLRCDFCITGESSWNSNSGLPVNIDALADRARSALARGARTIMILGGEPTIQLPTALAIAAAMPESAKLVWKTNAHGSCEARELLDGVFDVWLVDYKFGNDDCATRLARVPGYTQVVRENLRWAACRSELEPNAKPERGHSCPQQPTNVLNLRETTSLRKKRSAAADENVRAPLELIVRHLVMPGHVQCCWRPVAEWLATELPGVKVSLRNGFWPGWHSLRHTELCRTPLNQESSEAMQIAADCGLNLIQ
jgi:putative pyruvate formate lyase activating enzyme